MKLLRLILRADPLLFLSAAFLGLLSGALGAVILFLINQAASNYTAASNLAILFFVCLAVFLISEIAAQFLVIRISQRSVITLRNKIIANVLARSYWRSENRAAEILSALSADVATITQSAKGIPLLLTNVALIVGVIVYLFWLSWQLSLIFCVAFLFGTVSMDLIRRRARKQFVRSRKLQDRLFEHFRTIGNSLKEFKLNASLQNSFLKEDFTPTAENFSRRNTKAFTLFLASGSSGRIFFYVLIGTVLFGAREFIQVDDSKIVSFILAVIFMKGPVEWFLNWLPVLQRASVALDELEKFGGIRGPGTLEIVEPTPMPVKKIALKDLAFEYPGRPGRDPFGVGPLNLEFQPGLHFIVGGNGSGKTTSAKLLSALYTATSGKMIINDEITLSRENVASYRHAIGAVFQNVSVLSRISMTSNEDRLRVEKYLELFELAKKIRFINGYFTTVEALSVGQQKRLALISTLFYDRPVYIFDEWAADQDPRFRTIFYTGILEDLRKRNKIVIVISHDDRYYYVADQIIHLEYGQQIQYQPFENSLGQILLSRKAISFDQLEQALEEQRNSKLQEKLGETIVRLGFADSTTVRIALVAQLGLGQILLELGLITADQLETALQEQKETREGTRIGEVLVKLGYLTDLEVEVVMGMKIVRP